MFNKTSEYFPIKKKTIFLNSCGVSGLFAPAAERVKEILDCHCSGGMEMWVKYWGDLDRLHTSGAALLGTSSENMSAVCNTAEALSMIANGYPFESGDEIISYVHEYPSNHYPWVIQQGRGVVLKLLPDVALSSGLPEGLPRAWSMSDLEKLVTSRTRMLAISHVQFASGFAVDLKMLGEFCAERGIDFVVDAAQSLGVLPIDVERMKISALAASGWKWLAGPVGSSVMYTSKEFRKKLRITMAGPELMEQQEDYLDHSWRPLPDGRMFEYSSPPLAQIGGLATSVETIGVQYGIEKVYEEAKKYRRMLREGLDTSKLKPALVPVYFGDEHDSGIMSYMTVDDPNVLVKRLRASGLTCSTRGGYLRFAPHFFNTAEEMEQAIRIVNEVMG